MTRQVEAATRVNLNNVPRRDVPAMEDEPRVVAVDANGTVGNLMETQPNLPDPDPNANDWTIGRSGVNAYHNSGDAAVRIRVAALAKRQKARTQERSRSGVRISHQQAAAEAAELQQQRAQAAHRPSAAANASSAAAPSSAAATTAASSSGTTAAASLAGTSTSTSTASSHPSWAGTTMAARATLQRSTTSTASASRPTAPASRPTASKRTQSPAGGQEPSKHARTMQAAGSGRVCAYGARCMQKCIAGSVRAGPLVQCSGCSSKIHHACYLMRNAAFAERNSGTFCESCAK